MKISEMIKNLQEFMNEHGDMDCYYLTDDEGNDIKEVHYPPSVCYADEYGNFYHEDDDEVEFIELEAVCLVN